MSAVAPLSSSISLSSRRVAELEATMKISRITSSERDVTAAIESVAAIALRVNGVKGMQIQYTDPADGTSAEPFVWGTFPADAVVGSAVADICGGGQSWGELRLYFELQPSALENPLRFAKFLAQQVGLQLSQWSLAIRANALKAEIEQIRTIIERRKAIQRARALIANAKRIDDTEALRLMRQYSRESGRTLHQIAEAFIFGDPGEWADGDRSVDPRRSLRLLARKPVDGSAY
jgi:ANTAR domain